MAGKWYPQNSYQQFVLQTERGIKWNSEEIHPGMDSSQSSMNYPNYKLKNIHTLHAYILYTEGDIKLLRTQCR